jgi:hypothetical protein
MTLELLNPLQYPNWNGLLRRWEGATFFHTSCWARILQESYGYLPCFLGEVAGDHFTALLPCMEVRSPLTGIRGVSLPFTDYCTPLLPENSSLQSLFEALARHGREARWRSLELRPGSLLPEEMPPCSQWHHHILDLSKGETALFRGLRESTRRNIKKAERSEVEVTLETSTRAAEQFYRLNCLTRKGHGLPPQPFRFFLEIQKNALTGGHGMIALAHHQRNPVAGAVFFHFGTRAVYKYGASDRLRQHLRANNLVMWEAIKWYANKGFQQLSFGRTEPENEGLLQFKNGWGASEEKLLYCRYDLGRSAFLRDQPMVKGWHNKMFAALPLSLLRLAGRLLYRHVG